MEVRRERARSGYHLLKRFLIVLTSCSGYICCDSEARATRCTLRRPVPPRRNPLNHPAPRARSRAQDSRCYLPCAIQTDGLAQARALQSLRDRRGLPPPFWRPHLGSTAW
eukprot:4813611-Pyramimonas_sp.AAC.1